ncbi:hybrid sensor histidine kinase/response regulator [Persicimonas caeni]|nr:ATP-binding protein [Persicimonas caeni]
MEQTASSWSEDLSDPQLALVELGKCTLEAVDEEELWAGVVEILREPLAVDCVAALRCSADGEGLDLLAGWGVEDSLLGTRMVDVGAGTASDFALELDEPLVVDDTDTESRFLPSPVASRHDCKSGISVAISAGGQAWGVCELFWQDANQVTEEHTRFVAMVCDLLGVALERIEREKNQVDEKRLAEAEYERFFLLVENATDIIGMSDMEGQVTYLNPAGCALFGVEHGKPVSRAVEKFLPDDEAARLFGEIVPQVRARGSWSGPLTVVSLDSSSTHQTETTIIILREPGTRRAVGFATILRDVSEQKQLQEQLRQSQKLEALGLLAGGVAHDFNNHLTVIKGYSELLLASLPDGDARRAQLCKIHHVSEKAQHLADQLLTFSRRKVRQPRVLDLNAAVHSLYDMLRSLIGENIALNCVVDGASYYVEADPSDLEQVILNLAVNARDAIEGKGTITLLTRSARPDELDKLERAELLGHDPVVLEVRDTGVGMTEEVLEHLFEPFYTTKEAKQGTGLGLATVFRIITDAGGDIAVTSRPEQGSCFKLFFPRAEPVQFEQDEEFDEQVELEGDEVVLVVEDDPDVLDFVTDVLERHGYDAIASRGPIKAFELLDMYHDSIDAVICDVVLPNLSTEELREQLVDRYSHIPFVMTSGYTDAQLFQEEQLLADLPFVAKPMSSRDLLTQLRVILDARQPI